ncbi:hypothetical protein [Actinomadura miaoliensis]|uniref:Uncharacterized protein n=1 Tax=Actinomadura miaoliensis TaxID=430685 RepID=A0ABP7V8M3_9ACTN
MGQWRRLDNRWAVSARSDPALRPAYGVFYVGWGSWLRGKAIALGDTTQTARFHSDTAALAAEFDRSGPFLDAYPGQAWPVDSVVASATLRLHDRLFPPRYQATLHAGQKRRVRGSTRPPACSLTRSARSSRAHGAPRSR